MFFTPLFALLSRKPNKCLYLVSVGEHISSMYVLSFAEGVTRFVEPLASLRFRTQTSLPIGLAMQARHSVVFGFVFGYFVSQTSVST